MSELDQAITRAGKGELPRKDNSVADTFHGTRVEDPYRHLEDLDSAETQGWAGRQNARFERFISGYGKRAAMEKFLKDIWDHPRTSMPNRYGKNWFDNHNTGLQAQSVLRVRDARDGTPRTLIDPNSMSADGTVALSGTKISPNGKYVAYLTSEAGSDAQTLRVRDVATGQDLPDVIKDCRFTAICWDHDSDGGFTYSYPSGAGDRSFVLKHHTLGAAPATDPLVFETKGVEDNFLSLSRPRHGTHEWINTSVGTNPDNGLWLRKTGSSDPFVKLFDDGVASYSPVAEIDGWLYMQTDRDAPRGKLVRFRLDDPAPEKWETIIPESATDLLQSVFYHQGKLWVCHSHDCADQFAFHDTAGRKLGDVPLPPQSVFGLGRINKEDESFLIDIGDFLTPGAIYEYDIKTGGMTLFQASQAKADMAGCVVERTYATSKDGTKVPMTVLRHPSTKLDGTAATKLYGYGGFNVPLGPGFSKEVMNWVREGGIYAQANLRGGGEFGSEWYDGGRLLKKQNVFDDFHSCAEHLAALKYTSAPRLVIEGGSNGGLLTAACMLQRPELYGAVISGVPVMDMLRFHKHTYGSAWKSDYGDPEASEADFRMAMTYSPLHNVKAGAAYPPCLVQTADHDDRVVPSHAFKFVATMLEKADPKNVVLMRVETSAGHGAGKPTDKVIAEILDTHAFVETAIGPINQLAYKWGHVAAKPADPTPKPPAPAL